MIKDQCENSNNRCRLCGYDRHPFLSA